MRQPGHRSIRVSLSWTKWENRLGTKWLNDPNETCFELFQREIECFYIDCVNNEALDGVWMDFGVEDSNHNLIVEKTKDGSTRREPQEKSGMKEHGETRKIMSE